MIQSSKANPQGGQGVPDAPLPPRRKHGINSPMWQAEGSKSGVS